LVELVVVSTTAAVLAHGLPRLDDGRLRLERAIYMRSLVDFTIGSPDPRHFYARRDPIPWD